MVVLNEQVVKSRALIGPADDLLRITNLVLNGIRQPEKEKIKHLGKSLRNFSSVKSLDLSRNLLDNLEGLEVLPKLTKLNLYLKLKLRNNLH